MPQINLKNLFAEPGKLARLVGTHDAMGARLAERVGFDGVWASSLEISTSRGCADTGENTMTDVLSASASMAAAVDFPVVADCGPVIGGTPGVVNLVEAFESAGVTAVCMEDNLYPKTNSLLPGKHELVGIEEFSDHIRTAVRARKSSEFLIIARLESLIAGEPLDVALERAHSYAKAGADAILPHSKADTPDEVLEFTAAWDAPVPLVLIPTTYFSLSEREMRETRKVKMAIYANHGIRAAIQAMRRAFDQILSDGSTHEVRKWIAPLEDVFEIQSRSEAEACSDRA